MDELNGTWTLDRSENYDEFLKASGMGGFKRGMAVKLGGSLTIKPLSENKIYLKTVNGPKTKEKEITLNQEFDDEGADGTSARGSMTVEGKKLVATFETKKKNKVVITREIVDGLLLQTMEFDNISCKRFYKKK